MRILVAGGAGYFGQSLVERLQANHSVRIFDLNHPEDPPPEVECMRGDIRFPAAVRRACQGVDVVFHAVAQVPLAKQRAMFWAVNRDGTRNLLQACQEEGVQKVVYISSSAVFGVPRSNPVTEETEPT